MQPEQHDRVIQLNLADAQRIAARDYHEHVTPSTVELMLATWDMEKLDHQAKTNPYMFKLRYKFEETTIVRSQVVDFQRKHDLSDREIFWLKRSGHVRTTRTVMRIDTSRTLPILGWAQIVFFSLIIVLMVLQVGFSKAPEWQQGLGFLSLLGLWFSIVWVMNKLYIWPRQVLMQAGAMDAAQNANSEPMADESP